VKGFILTMKSIRSSLIVALVLTTAVVVVASPAFATPNFTASSGTRAVSPFVTPIGSTTSRSTARSTDWSYVLASLTWTCNPAHFSFYVATTHTQILITSMTFGDGRTGACTISGPFGGATVDGNSFNDPTTNSTTPSRLHFRSVTMGSTFGTINLSGPMTFGVTFGSFSCTFTVPVQSIDATYTQAATSLIMSDRTFFITITGAGCPASGNSVVTATYTIRPDTARDSRLTVTNAS
jgi:hypothetical protein